MSWRSRSSMSAMTRSPSSGCSDQTRRSSEITDTPSMAVCCTPWSALSSAGWRPKSSPRIRSWRKSEILIRNRSIHPPSPAPETTYVRRRRRRAG
ncbi:hypothetical protein ACFPRL_02255 [Pseudoclavibacter helvolus]